MLKGTRTAKQRKIQPVSVHGQVSYDVHYVFVEDDEERTRVARVGSEDVALGLEPGDRVSLEILLNEVVRVDRG